MRDWKPVKINLEGPAVDQEDVFTFLANNGEYNGEEVQRRCYRSTIDSRVVIIDMGEGVFGLTEGEAFNLECALHNVRKKLTRP